MFGLRRQAPSTGSIIESAVQTHRPAWQTAFGSLQSWFTKHGDRLSAAMVGQEFKKIDTKSDMKR